MHTNLQRTTTHIHINLFEALRKSPKQPGAKFQEERKNIKVNHWHFTAAFLFKAFISKQWLCAGDALPK